MLISYNWLKDYIDCTLDAAGVADLITNTGLEVEGIEYGINASAIPDEVLIAEVKEVTKHPDADRLTVCKVNTGSGIDIQVVCGAPNVAAGQKIAFAPVGTIVKNAKGDIITLANVKIRGVESAGMICAEDELGLGTDHSGIIVLEKDAPLGESLKGFLLKKADPVIEVAITPNRGDAVSHIGVARDIAAVLRERVLWPDISDFPLTDNSSGFKIEIDIPDLCPRYCGVLLSHVKVGASPEWMQERLKSVGINPINNIVDITNYVMMECGQPLHAFDMKYVEGNKIIVRHELKGSKFKTLDGREIILDGSEVMICDGIRPVAMGGVMGGENSMVTEDTLEVLIESACFNPVSIRKTAKRHGYSTDASYRFERGVDISLASFAAKRAALLMVKYAGARINSPLIDQYPVKVQRKEINLEIAFLNSFAGFGFNRDMLMDILDYLGYEAVSIEKERVRVLVPIYKTDVFRSVDLIEDILRIYSYNAVDFGRNFKSPLPAGKVEERIGFVNKLADYLVSIGFYESLTPSFLSSGLLEKHPPQNINPVKTLNAVNVKLDILRHNFLFSGLEVLSYNYKRGSQNLKFFEFGKVYMQKGSGEYIEKEKIAFWVTGNINDSTWFTADKKTDIYYLKGVVKNVLKLSGITGPVSEVVCNDDKFTYKLDLVYNKQVLGSIGMVVSGIAEEYDIRDDVFYAEIDFSILYQSYRRITTSFNPIPRYPAVWRDISLHLKRDVRYLDIRESVFSVKNDWIREIHLIDIYEGKNVAEGFKSYTIRIKFQDDKGTLRDEQVDEVVKMIINRLSVDLNVSIRK